MKPRHKRLLLIGLGLTVLGLGTFFVLSAFKENVNFSYTPTEVFSGKAPKGKTFRIGGMVEKGSVSREGDGVTVSFVVTDMAQNVRVKYRGILPDLFKEGKGVVAQGKLGDDKIFVADEVLAKHDENYMPPEAAYAMKKAKEAKEAEQAKAALTNSTGASANTENTATPATPPSTEQTKDVK